MPSRFARWLTRTDRFWERLVMRRLPRTTRRKVAFGFEQLEDRLVPARPLPLPTIYAGSGIGEAPVVKGYDADTGALRFTRTAFESGFKGGVHVAAGDITRDGYPDVIVAAAVGGGPRVRVLDGKTGDDIAGPLGSFWAFDPLFRGGVNVASADVDGDKAADVVVAAGLGGGPHVKVFSGATGKVIANFFAFDADFRGGISVAAADLTGDGKAEVAVGAGVGGGPHVKVYDPLSGTAIGGPLGSFFAFGKGFRGGLDLGADALAGDVDADGVFDLAVGSGPGMPGQVKVFSGATGKVIQDITPFGKFEGGVRVGLAYVDDDEYADVVTGTGPGTKATINVFNGKTGEILPDPMGTYEPFGDSKGGVFVAASNDPPLPVVTTFEHYPYSSEDSTGSIGLGFDVEGHPYDSVTVYYTLTGTATYGTDYTSSVAASGSITVPLADAGFGRREFYFNPVLDAVYDPDETIILTITADAGYSGGGETATGVIENVTLATTTELTSDSNPSVYGEAVTLTAAVDTVISGSWTPSGSVTFLDGETELGTGTLNSSGVATLVVDDPAFAVGTHSITAEYAGTNVYDPSSDGLSQVADKADTTTGLDIDPDGTIILGEKFELEASVAPVSPATGQPTGTVIFTATDTTTEVVYGLGQGTLGEDLHEGDDLWEAELLVSSLPEGTYTLKAEYYGDDNFNGSFGTTTLVVLPSPEMPILCACDCNGSFDSAAGGSGMAPAEKTAAGVMPGSGIASVKNSALPSGSPGPEFSQDVGVSNAAAGTDGVAGKGTAQVNRPTLVPLNGEYCIGMVVCGATFYFDFYDDAYHLRGGGSATLEKVGDEFIATDGAGNRYVFYTFGSPTPAGREGKLKSMTDATGIILEAVSWNGDGEPEELRKVTGTGSTAKTESYLSDFVATGANAGLLSKVTQRRRTGTGSWETVQWVEYSYYDGTTDGGNERELRLVEVKDASGNVLDTTYYRYYTVAEAAGSGDVTLLKAAFGSDAYARLTEEYGSSLDGLTDLEISPYADKFLTYDAEDRVVTAVDAAAGCSVCSGGLGNFAYAYSSNSGATGLLDSNTWTDKTVETLPDGNTNTYYTNRVGQLMLKVYTDTTTYQSWLWYTRYDDNYTSRG